MLSEFENTRRRTTAKGEDQRNENIYETDPGPFTEFRLPVLHHVSA